MKGLLRLVAIVVVLAVLAGAAAEFMLVRQARKAAQAGRIGLGEAAMLVDPARIGGRFSGVTLPLSGGRDLALSGLELWVPVLGWNIPHASLPAEARLTGPAGTRVLGFGAGGTAQAQFSPWRGMVLTGAQVQARQVRLDGQPLADEARIAARLTNYGAVIPAEVQAAYRIDADMAGLNLPLLARLLEIGQPSGDRPGEAGLQGPLVLWLSEVIAPGLDARPQVLGATFEGLRITIDGAGVQVWGQLGRDASGGVTGELALDSADWRAFVLALAHAGYLPLSYAQLTASALETVARDAAAATPEDAVPVSSPNHIALRQSSGPPHIPPRPAGTERIPLRIEGGQVFLGNLALSAILQHGGTR